jgi:hypothetical protein
MRLPRLLDGYWPPILCIVMAFQLLVFTKAMILTPFLYLMIGLSIGVGFLHRGSITSALWGFSGTLLACIVSATLPWWRRQQPSIEITSSELLFFAVLLLVAASVLLSRRPTLKTNRVEEVTFIGIYVAITAYFSFSLASTAEPGAMLTLWHHWGAYIGPSELILSGARLFHDIPAQYGAGPTLLLAFACGEDCWVNAYWVVGVTTFAYSMLIGAMARIVSPGGRYRNMLLLLLCIVTCTFWIAYPPAASSPNVTPSTSGMRFLPVVMMAAWIIFTGKKFTELRIIVGHSLWVIGSLWSPESAFYVTAVWWPVYLFDCSASNSQGARFAALMRAFGRLIALATGTVSIVLLVYYAAYGVFPVSSYIIAYMLYPPGPMPINPHGTIWYFGFQMALSVCVSWVTWRASGDSTRFRRSFTLQLLAFATFAYYLGRSHDNNLLNLLPFVMLVLLDCLASSSGIFARKATAFSLASLLAWLAVFGWQSWLASYQTMRLTDYGFFATRALLDYSDSSTAANMAKRIGVGNTKQIDQTSQLMEQLSKRGEPFMVLDQFLVLQPKYPAKPWSAINGPANFAYIPSSMRREFLVRTANQLGRDGWLIVARDYDSSVWLADFDSAYDRTERIDLDAAYAIRFKPKASLRKIAPSARANALSPSP